MRTVAIIPAYNEEKTIAETVRAAKASPYLNEVYVVNDGSSDNTSQKAKEAGAVVIEMGKNRGKGAALQQGLESTCSDLVVFLDADLIGLKARHIEALVLPVLLGEAGMTLGIFAGGRKGTDLAMQLCPFLTGQRALKRATLDHMKEAEGLGYGIEVELTRLAKARHIACRKIRLRGVSHMRKEEKFGFIEGMGQRLRMCWDIVRALA